MDFQLVVGMVAVFVGIVLFLARRPFAQFAHGQLKKIYGEEFANLTVTRRRGNVWGILVAIVFVLAGIFFIMDAIWKYA